MKKTITIVGAGISGLTVLHYLRKEYEGCDSYEFVLLEASPQVGGTIQSLNEGGIVFESGPNGFLDSKPGTMNLIKDLNLFDSLIFANPQTKLRYIAINEKLIPLPTGPISFLKFPCLSILDKMRVLQEFFIPPGNNDRETVAEFGIRRLGKNFVDFFLVPMVRGIFAGDAYNLNLKYAFPRIYEIEQKHGSLIKGLLAVSRQKKKSKNSFTAGQPSGQLCSLKYGMGQLVQALYEKNKSSIYCGVQVLGLKKLDNQLKLLTNRGERLTDRIILAVPAYQASAILKEYNPQLSLSLSQVSYAPVLVIGFLYDKAQFKRQCQGFGYIRLPQGKNPVLGTIFSSNLFVNRAPDDKIFIQVLLGGVNNPDLDKIGLVDLIKIAQNEIEKVLGVIGAPKAVHSKFWHKGIPQYTREYPQIIEKISATLQSQDQIDLLANYVQGIAMNDCIANAKILSEKLAFED